MEGGTHDALVEDQHLVHANQGVIEAGTDSGLGIKVIVDLLNEEGLEDFLIKVGGGPDPVHLEEGISEEDGELIGVLTLHVMKAVG